MRALRLTLYALASLTALALALVWIAPDALDALGKQWIDAKRAHLADEFRAVATARSQGTDEEERALEAWQRRLGRVRKLDTAALAQRYLLARRRELAELRGDHGAALALALGAARFDRYDVDAVATLGRLQARSTATRQAGLETLRKLRRRVPDHPDSVCTLVRALVHDGEHDEARRVVLDAADPRHIGAWTIRWGPEPVRDASFVRPYSLGDTRIALDFVAAHAWPLLEIQVPEGYVGRVTDLQITIGDDTRDLRAWEAQRVGIREDGAIDEQVARAQRAGFVLPRAIAAGTRIRVCATVRARLASWLRELLRSSEGAALAASNADPAFAALVRRVQ